MEPKIRHLQNENAELKKALIAIIKTRGKNSKYNGHKLFVRDHQPPEIQRGMDLVGVGNFHETKKEVSV